MPRHLHRLVAALPIALALAVTAPAAAATPAPSAPATTVSDVRLSAPVTRLVGTATTTLTVEAHLSNPGGVHPVRAVFNDGNGAATCPCLVVRTGTSQSARAVDPQAGNDRTVPLELVGGTPEDGLWRGTTTLGAVNAGIWRVSGIFTEDLHAENLFDQSPVTVPALEAAAFNLRGADWPRIAIAAVPTPRADRPTVISGTARLSRTGHAATGLRLAVYGGGCEMAALSEGALLGKAVVGRDGRWRTTTTTADTAVCVRYAEAAVPTAAPGSWAAQVVRTVDLSKLRRTVTAAPVAASAEAGTDVRVRGRIWPRASGGDVRLQRRVGRTWRQVGQAYTGTTGTYTLVATPPARGANSYRVLLRRGAFGAAYSKSFTITGR
ncbi:hypothetical protein CLV35_2197 [Motilibacter peucedani]|uniref:Ig-like domain-containing protein n=1 Tax=Motilibacter peucedani TaxID=598650 RepID=A0A420XR16_9ACTN|nr:hypothetical protein [Motilibacter peucedani]RKS75720.1 hypothetical protein CLV35_2197 [Motilibacter peucedani]